MKSGRPGSPACDAGVDDPFDKAIAPCCRDVFIRDHFNRDMLYMKGGPGRYRALLDWADLDAALQSNRLDPPRLQIVMDDKFVSPERYTQERLGARIIDAGAATMLLRQGASLVLSLAEELLPRVRDLTESAEEALGAYVNANLYASWGEKDGFGLHFDNHDVLVLQLRGRKRWRIYDPTFPSPTRSTSRKAPRPEGEPKHDLVLEDGDLLFLPRGWWHHASPMKGESLHMTLALTPPTARNLLTWLADRMERKEVGRADMPPPSEPEARAAYLARLLRAIEEEFAAGISEPFAEAREAERPARPKFNLAKLAETETEILPETAIRLASNRRIRLTDDDGSSASVIVGGRHWPCASTLLPALRALRSYRAHRFEQLVSLLPDPTQEKPLRQLLLLLSKTGAVFLESAEGSAE